MNFSQNTAESFYSDLDSFFLELFEESIDFQLAFKAEFTIVEPFLNIVFNGDLITKKTCCLGQNAIFLKLEPKKNKKNTLEISMSGKLASSTIVENNIVVKDTYIELLKIHMNNYSLLDDFDFFNNYFLYITEDGDIIKPMSGFWKNNKLILEFESPFDLWYNLNSTKNASINQNLKYRLPTNLDELISSVETNLKKLI